MRVAILQPSYLPWLGCFEQIAACDVFVFYDDVQYDKNGWRNRNRIKTPGGAQWLTVPILSRGRHGQRIVDTRIDHGQRWAARHLHALETNYRRAAHYEWCDSLLRPALLRRHEHLADLTCELTMLLAAAMGIGGRFERSSMLDIQGGQTERLVNICRHFGAAEYYSGAAARDYLDVSLFERHGIRVMFQDYRHPVYPQLHGPFVSHLSIVDLLMNLGPQAASALTATGPVGS